MHKNIPYRNILFVCTGNSCRSPIAEVIFKKLLQDKLGENSKNIKVKSAGTSASIYEGATQEAIQAVKEKGLDLSSHKSKKLTQDLAREADIILVMTASHKDEIINNFPEDKSKVFILRQYANSPNANIEYRITNNDYDIFDPIGQPLEVYRQTAQVIEENLKKILDKWTT